MIMGHIKTNDILIVKDGATTGKVSHVNNSFNFSNAVINEHLFLCRVSKLISSNYIFFFLWSKTGQKLILKNNKTGERASINRAFASNLKIPLPPIKEQKQIADIIDKKLKIIKAKREKLKKEFEVKYLMLTEKVLDNGFNFYNIKKQDKNANIIKISKIAKIIMGQSPNGSSYNVKKKGIPLINGPTEFENKLLGRTIIKQYTTEPTKICKKDDLLICVRGSTTGRVNIANFDACIGRGVAAIRANNYQNYLNFFFVKQRKNILKNANGTTFPSINRDYIENILIPFPNEKNQKEIVKKIEQSFEKAKELKTKFEEVIKELENTEKELFIKAFSGQLSKPIKNDTPVSELLDKIKEEKIIIEKQRNELRKKRRNMPKPKKTQLDIIEVLKLNEAPMLAADVWKNAKYSDNIN